MSNAPNNRRPRDNNLNNNDANNDDLLHNCNICMERAAYGVISFCGHLFCWPCIHHWMDTRARGGRQCPVCHAEIGTYTLIPLDGTFDDRHLVKHRLQNVERPESCPTLGQQKDRATAQYNGLVVQDIGVPLTSMFLTGRHFHPPRDMDRANPLAAELMPLPTEQPAPFLQLIESSYFPRSIAIFIMSLVFYMTLTSDWEHTWH